MRRMIDSGKSRPAASQTNEAKRRERKARLGRALRDNLRKRKAPGPGKKPGEPPGPQGPPPRDPPNRG